MRVKISNGHIVNPATQVDRVGDIFIADGKIISLFDQPTDFKFDREIDATGKLVCPGLIDLCAHMREPGAENKATITSETLAAISGGITSICCPPDTEPVIDTPAVTELIHQRAVRINKAHIYTLGAMTHGLHGERLAEMDALKRAGCVGISNAQAPIENTDVLLHAMEYTASCDMTLYLYAEDSYLGKQGVAHEGPVSTRLGLPGIPETAETIAISRALLLIEQTGVRAHFCRLSSGRGVSMIADARKRGLAVSADVGICHLHLTEMDINGFNSNCHLSPPLRSQRDKEMLQQGVANGSINAVCSDHQPHDMDAKSAPFALTEPGASTIELLLPLMLHLVDHQVIDLTTAIAALTINPARILGSQAGNLETDMPADICIIDPDTTWDVDNAALISAGKNSPFHGWGLTSRVTHTLYNGIPVFER
ncbi:MAG: dihydroorotase [Gammaproteobacteria bacterium]